MTTTDFNEGGPIPARCTCDGANEAPHLEVHDVPADAESLVLLVLDPDAPRGPFTHWLVWNLPPATRVIGGDAALPRQAVEGRTDFGRAGYGGPCPPPGAAHTYRFVLHALRSTVDLPPRAGREELDHALADRVLATAELKGTYGRQRG